MRLRSILNEVLDDLKLVNKKEETNTISYSYKDSQGGELFFVVRLKIENPDYIDSHDEKYIKANWISLISWNSIPDDKRYGDDQKDFKKRGFSYKCLDKIKEISKIYNITELRVWRPTNDTKEVFKKFVEKRLVKPTEYNNIFILN